MRLYESEDTRPKHLKRVLLYDPYPSMELVDSDDGPGLSAMIDAKTASLPTVSDTSFASAKLKILRRRVEILKLWSELRGDFVSPRVKCNAIRVHSAKVSMITGNKIKNYQSLGDKSGKWKAVEDESLSYDSYENEFEGIKGFYSSYIYTVRENKKRDSFDLENYKNVKFYKLKVM